MGKPRSVTVKPVTRYVCFAGTAVPIEKLLMFFAYGLSAARFFETYEGRRVSRQKVYRLLDELEAWAIAGDQAKPKKPKRK